ncbi:MAG: hypothetical protein GY705_30125 [Bacteroidetes bacterium]|nr:hypothetical protein [Bacteroidota bacterium]
MTMIKKKCLSEYFNKLDKEFHYLYMDVLASFERDTIEKFRFNLSRQLALFRLIEAINPRFYGEEALVMYDNLLEKAGDVRRIQQEIDLFDFEKNEERIPPDLADLLNSRENKSKKKFIKYGWTHSLAAYRENAIIVRKSLERMPETEIRERLISFCNFLLVEITTQAQIFKLKNKNIVEIRKKISQLYYNLEIINKCFKGIKLKSDILHVLVEMQETMGHREYLEYVLKRLQKKVPSSDQLAKQFRKEASDLDKEVKTMVKNFKTTAWEIRQAII